MPLLPSDPPGVKAKKRALRRIHQFQMWRAYCLDEAVVWFGQTFEGMLQECAGQDDKPRDVERKQIKLMQQVFGKEWAPKLKYASMRPFLEKKGLEPGQSVVERG